MFVEDVVNRLVAQCGLVKGTTIFWNTRAHVATNIMPHDSAPYVTVVAYAADQSDLRTHNGGGTPDYTKPRAAIRVLGKQPSLVWALAFNAWHACHVVNTELSGTWYVRLRALQSEPFDMGSTDSGLMSVAFNIEAEKEREGVPS